MTTETFVYNYTGVNNGDWGGMPDESKAVKEAMREAHLAGLLGYRRAYNRVVSFRRVPCDMDHRDICMHVEVTIKYDPKEETP